MLQPHNRRMDFEHALPPERAAHGAQAPALPEWVGFKWLMGLQGHRLDVGRLQDDPAYALDCLLQASRGPDPALRAYAERLRLRLR
jgi:hypothetical protein